MAAGPVAAQTKIKPGFNLFSPEQDQEIGRQSADAAEKQLPILDDQSIEAYVDRIGKRLAAVAPGPEYPYQFKVVNASDINAFALPGGYLYVNRGLIEAAKNEGQLAGVIGHEIAHVALRHGTSQASKAYLAQAGLGILGGLVGKDDRSTEQTIALVGGFGLNALFLKFSRKAEEQADITGAQMMAAAGFDPADMVDFFEILADEQGRNPGKVEQFFSSHPSPANRAARINEEIALLTVKPTQPVGGFAQVKSELGRMGPAASMQQIAQGPSAPAPAPRSGGADRSVPEINVEGPSTGYRVFAQRDGFFRIGYPDNWRVYEAAHGYGVIIAPDGGYVDAGGKEKDLISGVIVNHYDPFEDDPSDRSDSGLVEGNSSLVRATNDLLGTILRNNPDMHTMPGYGAKEQNRRSTFALRGPLRALAGHAAGRTRHPVHPRSRRRPHHLCAVHRCGAGLRAIERNVQSDDFEPASKRRGDAWVEGRPGRQQLGYFFARRAVTQSTVAGDAPADDALGVALQRDALPIAALRVPEQQPIAQRRIPAEHDLQRFLGHQRADDARHRREHAVALAIAEPLVLVVVEARVARAVAVVRKHGDLPFDAHGGARDERHAASDARAIDGEARREVVGAVEHDVDVADGGLERGAVETLRQRGDFDAGFSAVNRFLPPRRPSARRRRRAVKRICRGKFVSSTRSKSFKHEPADAARREIERRRAAEPAQADDEHARAAELALALRRRRPRARFGVRNACVTRRSVERQHARPDPRDRRARPRHANRAPRRARRARAAGRRRARASSTPPRVRGAARAARTATR